MQVRSYNSLQDYKTIQKWMQGYSDFTTPEAWLSDTGFMIDNHACVFLYTTNSKIAYLEFLIGNPEIKDKDIKNEALNKVIEHAMKIASNIGYKFIFAFIEKEYVENRFIDLNFNNVNVDVKMMMRGI